jgi:hypothetical protein
MKLFGQLAAEGVSEYGAKDEPEPAPRCCTARWCCPQGVKHMQAYREAKAVHKAGETAGAGKVRLRALWTVYAWLFTAIALFFVKIFNCFRFVFCCKCKCCAKKIVPYVPRPPVDLPWLDAAKMPGASYIEIIGATGLAKADLLGASDPYCVIYFNDEKVGKTRVRKNTLEPIWNEKFPITYDDQARNVMRIEMYDWDRMSADDFMGQVEISSKGLLNFPTVPGDFEFTKTEFVEKVYHPDPDLMGKLADKHYKKWEKEQRKYKKNYDSWNELVQGTITIRVFDAQAWAKWQDQTQVFMSRMERLKLETMVAASFAARLRRGSFVILPPHSHFIWRFPLRGTNCGDE